MKKPTTSSKSERQDEMTLGATGAPEAAAAYEPPSIRVFTEEEILSQLGPAQLYAGSMPFEF